MSHSESNSLHNLACIFSRSGSQKDGKIVISRGSSQIIVGLLIDLEWSRGLFGEVGVKLGAGGLLGGKSGR